MGYSEGTLVAEQEKRHLQAQNVGTGPNQAPAADTLTFTEIASPFAGNGGIFGRFQEIPTFLIVDNMGSASPSRYDTHYVVNEYDPYGDFPAYANPFSLANSLLAVEYAHPDTYYDNISSQKLGPDKEVPNGGGGTDTYTIYYNPQLPLLGPIRQGAALIGVSQYVEPELQLVEADPSRTRRRRLHRSHERRSRDADAFLVDHPAAEHHWRRRSTARRGRTGSQQLPR